MIAGKNQLFYIVLMFALFFVILGIISFFNIDNLTSTTIGTLFAIWILNMLLLLLLSYYCMLKNYHFIWFIFILYLLTLIFSTLFAINMVNNLPLANLSIIFVLIFSLALIYLSAVPMHILGILYILLWLGTFNFLNV